MCILHVVSYTIIIYKYRSNHHTSTHTHTHIHTHTYSHVLNSVHIFMMTSKLGCDDFKCNIVYSLMS